ncbi:variable surface lipoprotein [Metamycoplasma auris]|uniref:variable surface lipoprotein n=1 Tax=Metamycoplasma auris TaxID=51363 RepID=UPI0003AA0827|nr:variable surface lipoprotein [Metamycoplasma auris]
MNKKIKILTSLSLSLVSLPLIAASCKKRVDNSKNNTELSNKDSHTHTHTTKQ